MLVNITVSGKRPLAQMASAESIRGKTRGTIQLDNDGLEWFPNEVDSAGRGNYQILINLTRNYSVSRSREPPA